MIRHTSIFETLRHEILAGKYEATKVMPSEMELAKRFECSRPTISRVMLDLKREGLVVTRAGVPAQVSGFALNATGALGMVVPGENYTEIFSPICAAIERIAEGKGWDVIRGEIKSTDARVRAREARKLAYQFSKEHVAGVFFQPLEFIEDYAASSLEIISYFDMSMIPVCLLDYDIMPPPDRSGYDLVGIDNFMAGFTVGRELLKRGAKKIAFLQRPGAAPTVGERMHGVASAVIEAGGSWSLKENVLRCEPEDRRRVNAFVKKCRPDAIVSGNDVAAARLKECLGSESRILLGGFDGLKVAEENDIVTCRQPIAEIAQIAVDTLLSRIKSPSLPTRTSLLYAERVT